MAGSMQQTSPLNLVDQYTSNLYAEFAEYYIRIFFYIFLYIFKIIFYYFLYFFSFLQFSLCCFMVASSMGFCGLSGNLK